MTLLADQERYDLFYYPLLQCLKGFSMYDIFPKTIEGYQQDGYDMKSIHFLKLFQESYYQRYLINRMIESLQESSIDPCQLAFVREIQQICLLVDTSLDTVHSHIQQQQQEQEQHRNAVDFQRDDPSIPILQKRPISTPSYAAYIFKETSFHRSVINWIFQLIATRELMDIPLYELPENQELVQILSKYDDTATWIQYFPKNIDLFQILLQQYYASERTITTASYSRTKLLYHRPMVSSEHNLLLHQDYFRTILYFHCCQSMVSTMIQSTILQTTAQIFTQSELQLINNYQEMIQFFLTYSLNDFFETNHANRERTSDASSSAAAKSLNILSDMGLSINLYIYSIVIKLLLISRSNNIRSATIMNSWKPKKRVQKGQHQKENNFPSTPTQIDFENIQEHVMDLVNHLFTSANAFDYHSGLIVTDPLPSSSASLEWLNQYSPEIMADGIKMLLNLGQASSLLNPNRVRRQLLPTKRLEINAKKLVDPKTVIPPIPPAIGRERADNPSKNQSSIEHPPLPNVANKSSESVEKGIPLEANNQSRVPQNPVNKAYSVIAEREVDAQLYSEAEQFLREKYDFLMKEIDNRRKKTQWQIKRLKSMERSRKRLILLFQSESLQWEKEKEIQEALFPLKDPDYSNPLLLSARVNSAVTGSGGGEEALGDKEDLFETQSIAMSDLTEDESAMSISVASVIENRALSFSEEKKEGGHSIQSASISRDRKINNIDTEALNQLATIQEVEEEEEIVAPPILPIQEQSLLTDPIIAVLEQEIEKAEEVISTGHGELKDKQLVIQVQVEIPSIEEKKSDEISTIKEITLYERIKQEFYQNYSQLTQAIDQESLFEQLANYLPFSFLFLGINTKALNLLPKAQTDRPIIYTSTTTSALPDKRPLPSSVQQLLSSDSSARKYYQRHLMHHPNITKDLFDYLLSQSYIEEKMHSTLSIQFLQNRSCYASMLRSDELLNQRLFQKIFYEDHLLQIISIFQQYFLISSKHQFIIDLTSDLIEEYYQDYLISFYDLLSSAETAGSVGTAPTAFNLTPWLYHPQPMHYFQQRGRRKAQLQKEHETDEPDANANFVQFVSPLWTTTNLFNTVDKLLKLNLYPREMNQYRKCVQYDIPSTHPHHSSSSSPVTLLSYQSDMKDPKLWIWKQFLSKDLLSTLQLHFAIPYPLNCFFHASLLQKTSLFTQRYLEVYQLVKSYQLLWSELKQWKQYSSGRRASTSNSDLLQTTPAEERQKFSHHQYYRILHVYYYSLGTILQAFHQYMNNRVMMANYHLYEAFRGFYISFLSKQVPSPRNGTAASSSDQMSFVIHILEAYGRELAESSFQFEQEKPNEPPEEGKFPTNHHLITTFSDLQHLMENNIHRINTISMIKYYITACLEECRHCLAQFFLIIFTEKAKQQQDKMLVANNLYDTFYDRTEPLKKKNPAVGVENKDKGKEQATGKEKEKVNNGRRNPLSDKSMGKAISILKFHLMKITEYQKLIQDYGRKLTSSPSPSLPSAHHYQYKTHIQTLLMYLFPQQQ